MNLPPDPRLDTLFVRYWDDLLTAAETVGLEQRLARDPAAAEQFRALGLQAVAAAEALGAVPAQLIPGVPLLRQRGWSRRRALRTLAWGGAAASLAGGFLGWHAWSASHALARLTGMRGNVVLRTPKGEALPLSESVPAGGTVATQGPDSSVVVHFHNGTKLALTGDSVISLSDNGREIWLRQGNVNADVPPIAADDALSLATTEATLTPLSGVLLTMGRIVQGTEVEVEQGWITVIAANGSPLGIVRNGELLTVQAEGESQKQAKQPTPEEFTWDLANPLPTWHVGQRLWTPGGPVLRPRSWFDPFHQTDMFQVRSDKQWTRGFIRLYPDSLFRIRYWVDHPGPSQLCLCVRTTRTCDPATDMLEWNGAFTAARPGAWQWLEVAAGDMLSNVFTPNFGPPWVGFLIIFNTYKIDLGLKIAEFRVARPNGPDAGI